jgi:RNA polymerase sigma factor (sigma-70 family)
MIQLMKKRRTKLLETSQAESGSQEFESIFREYWVFVYRILHRLVGDPAEAEDLALETFLRLHQRSRIKEEDGFQLGGWLYRVATNLGLRSIRSFKRRERYEIEAGRFALEESRETRPAELHAQAEEQDLARQALAKMNERQSQLLILRYSGLSYKEIAGSLGLSPTSIGPLLVRAEREFEECYRALAQEEV